MAKMGLPSMATIDRAGEPESVLSGYRVGRLRGYGEMAGNRVYGVFFSMEKITAERVEKARRVFSRRFGVPATVMVAGKQREAEAREAAGGLAVEVRAGIIGGEFWLGGAE